ncbi:MAG: hypothetical protein WC895_02815 [Candidatus Shapirobacteria bacterium]|jgi:hypothetical protein
MNECSHWQAEDMAKLAGIDLNERQIQSYIIERDKIPTGNEEEGSFKPWCLSDQELFNKILE